MNDEFVVVKRTETCDGKFKVVAPRRTYPRYGPRILDESQRPTIRNHRLAWCDVNEPSTSRVIRIERQRPLILQPYQKSKSRIETHEEPLADNIIEEEEEDPYVNHLRKLFHQREQSKFKQRGMESRIGEIPEEMANRIMKFNFPCDVNTFSCLYQACGRTFESIEVLAFHLTYSHQPDVKNPPHHSSLICLVCGKYWNSSKNKLNHASSKHRQLGEEHNAQCLLQDTPVISPDAPKAIRLVNNSLKSRFSDQYGQNVVVFQNEIEDDDPFIVEDNFEETAYF